MKHANTFVYSYQGPPGSAEAGRWPEEAKAQSADCPEIAEGDLVFLRLFRSCVYEAGRSTWGGADFFPLAALLNAINSFSSYRKGPYARNFSSSNNRLAPQPRQT